MANYDVTCPIRYPRKCNLSSPEKENLEGPGKYTVFFMYQFKDNDAYLGRCVNSFFKSPRAYLLDASESPGTGVKLCKICRYTLASDFGVAALTPPNLNVFLEVGMLLGLGKPVLYLVNPGKCKSEDLPFDLSQEIVIEHTTEGQLREKLDKEYPLFVRKVKLKSEFQRRFEISVKQKLQKLGDQERQILEYLLLENRRVTEHELLATHKVHQQSPEIRGLCQYGFLEQSTSQYSSIGRDHSIFWYQIHPNYRQILEEVIFEESTDTSEKER